MDLRCEAGEKTMLVMSFDDSVEAMAMRPSVSGELNLQDRVAFDADIEAGQSDELEGPIEITFPYSRIDTVLRHMRERIQRTPGVSVDEDKPVEYNPQARTVTPQTIGKLTIIMAQTMNRFMATQKLTQ